METSLRAKKGRSDTEFSVQSRMLYGVLRTGYVQHARSTPYTVRHSSECSVHTYICTSASVPGGPGLSGTNPRPRDSLKCTPFPEMHTSPHLSFASIHHHQEHGILASYLLHPIMRLCPAVGVSLRTTHTLAFISNARFWSVRKTCTSLVPRLPYTKPFTTIHPFGLQNPSSAITASNVPVKRAIVAFGSNLGNRVANIQRACSLIQQLPCTRILRTSRLWETKPMYVLDQADFLNGVCEVRSAASLLYESHYVND